LLALLAVCGGAPAVLADPPSRLDRFLDEQLAAASDDTPLDVIITMRPGARHGVLQKLAAHGARVGANFGIIEAVAAQLPAGLLRSLAKDKDVLAISYDGPVRGDGCASAVSGTALNSLYSLRSTLGLDAPSANSTSRTFQHGDTFGSTTVDTGIDLQNPDASFSTPATYQLNKNRRSLLIRFDNLFGGGPNQIPYGSTITSAELRIFQKSGDMPTTTASVFRMLVPWDGSATWNSMSTSGPGIQWDNVEANATPDASVTGLGGTDWRAWSGAGLTATLQAWSSGAPNYGWVLWQDANLSWTVYSSEQISLAKRPTLSVTYRAPVSTTSLTGAGVTVAVVDSGLIQDDGGAGRLKTSRDFRGGNANPAAGAAADQHGHGTHVGGLIGGSAEVKGIAPGVQYVSLRVLDANGSGQTSDVVNAIQWAVSNRAPYGLDVLNLSLGHPIYEPAATDPLVQAVEAAVRAGIVVVVSAGNVGVKPETGLPAYGGITSPGNAPSAITVGSAKTFDTTTRTDDLIADYSSRGPTWYDAFVKPDLVAPGHKLLGPAAAAQQLYAGYPSLHGPSFGSHAYMRLSGTSMSAGVVSGTVALMIERAKATFGAKPTPNAIKAMLMSTAFPMTDAA
jgi:hypothetical protein